MNCQLTQRTGMGALRKIETLIKYDRNELFDSLIENIASSQSYIAESDIAEYFLNWFGHSMFYNIDSRQYHIFNGKFYKVDSEALLLKRKVMEFITEFITYCNVIGSKHDILLKATRMKSQNNIDKIIDSLKIHGRKESKEIETDDHLFNVQNGILDIDKAELLIHSPDYLITKIADVEYHPEHGEVDRAVKDILLSFFLGDEEILNFMFEFLGTCLSGYAAIRKFIYAFGTGKNGKSTFFDFFLNNFFGNYSATANFSTFTGKRDATKPSSDLVSLYDKRLTVTNEAETNVSLNTNLIKTLTGGDKVNGRLNFMDEQEFTNHTKIIMFGNNQLDISDSSEGMMDRFVQIPFKAKFNKSNQKKQKEIWAILIENKSKILNSLLAGYKRVQLNGFTDVKSIREESLSGFTSANNFTRFMMENLIEEEGSNVKTKDLYEKYKKFADEEDLNRSERLRKSAVVSALKSSGIKVSYDRSGVEFIKDYRLNVNDGLVEVLL